MENKNKQISHRLKTKINGETLIAKVPEYCCYQDNSKEFCTIARKFIKRHSYKSPCVITVHRYDGKNEKFFYSITGLFRYNYAIINHQQFRKEIEEYNAQIA